MSNSTKQGDSTEEHIKQVAKRVFIEKGYAGTTTRDIAVAADANQALINYYFRSKEKLFKQVFEESVREFFNSMLTMLNSDKPLREKLDLMIERDFEFLGQNPEITLFIFNEMRTSEHHLAEELLRHDKFWNTYFFQQVQTAIEQGEMRPMRPIELITLVLGNVQFIFMAKPMIKMMGQLDEKGYNELKSSHKDRIKEMIFGYLFLK
jgi:AcrR family transcriptional regulator